MASVCSGSILLAETGLLDGRTCAGHWAYADLFAEAYPRVAFQPGAILDLANEADGMSRLAASPPGRNSRCT